MKRLFLVFSILLANLAAFADRRQLLNHLRQHHCRRYLKGRGCRFENIRTEKCVLGYKPCRPGDNLPPAGRQVVGCRDALRLCAENHRLLQQRCGQRLKRCPCAIHRKEGEYGRCGEKLQCQPVEIPAGGVRLYELLN